MKTCTKCAKEKPLEDFYAKRSNENGLTAQCKKCISEKQVNYRLIFGRADYESRPQGRPPKALSGAFDFDASTDIDVADAVASGGMEFSEIANRLGCTRQAVQQCQERALAKLKRYCQIIGISLEDFITEARK